MVSASVASWTTSRLTPRIALDERIDELEALVRQHYGLTDLGDPSASTDVSCLCSFCGVVYQGISGRGRRCWSNYPRCGSFFRLRLRKAKRSQPPHRIITDDGIGRPRSSEIHAELQSTGRPQGASQHQLVPWSNSRS